MPLFHEFAAEDWQLMSLGFELHLIVHAIKKDIQDEERSKIHIDHIAFYFEKYYRKQIFLKNFGVENIADLVALAKDVVYITKGNVLASALDGELESFQVFAKIAEEARRHRALMIDAGEDSHKLNFAVAAPQGEGKGWVEKGEGKGWGKNSGKGFGKNVLPPFAGKGGKQAAFTSPAAALFTPGARPPVIKGNGKGFKGQSFGTPGFGSQAGKQGFKGAGK